MKRDPSDEELRQERRRSFASLVWVGLLTYVLFIVGFFATRCDLSVFGCGYQFPDNVVVAMALFAPVAVCLYVLLFLTRR